MQTKAQAPLAPLATLPIGSHAQDCPRRLGWWPGEAQPPCTCGLLTTDEQGGKDGQRR